MAKDLVNEIVYETDFVKYAAERGCYAYKFVIPGRRGAPDRIIFCPEGRTLFIEFKREDGKLSRQQKTFHGILTSLGFTVYTAWNFKDACDTLDAFLARCN